MMYNFQNFEVGNFKIFKSSQVRGDEHKKRFIVPGVTPKTQETLNIYAAGEFKFEIPDISFSQIIEAGGTSLDLKLSSYPVNAVCIERVLSASALRYCASPTKSAPWDSEIIILEEGESLEASSGDCIFVVSGSILDGSTESTAGDFTSPTSIAVATQTSKVIVLRIRATA